MVICYIVILIGVMYWRKGGMWLVTDFLPVSTSENNLYWLHIS